MYAISTRLLLVAGRASRVPKGTYHFSSIVSRRYANHRCAGHATMSTTGGSDRLIRVQALSQTYINIFANFTTLFRFLFFAKKKRKKIHTICNNRPHIVDPSYSGRTKAALWLGAIEWRGACTVIKSNKSIDRKLGRHSCVARAAAICTSSKVSAVIQRSRRNNK